MKNLFAVILVLFFAAACNKTEDVVIKDNIPPPDHTIDSSVMSIYVNKAYINLLGREPVGNERTDAVAILRQDNFSLDNRKQFINSLFPKPEYIRNLYNVANNEYLRNVDSMEIAIDILTFQNLLADPNYAPFYSYLQFEMYRLDTLQTVLPQMIAGTMDYRQMLSRMTNNYIYDQINMGSENFVVSLFQNFLLRYPGLDELQSGKNMVDGNVSTVFFKVGKSKYDYINIFFGTDDYYEGQVRFIFKKYMYREPTSAEIYLYSGVYKTTNDYKELERAIFTLDEYAGL